MSNNVIETDNVSKRYPTGGSVEVSRTLRDAIRSIRVGRSQGANSSSNELWALRDVSFTVGEGETVGVIGRNGAGKSTLLKILARITQPTHGRSRTRGRVGSLLEVGTGFHLELTGRENIYLNGAVLGMSRREIRRRFDEIAAFSGIEHQLDMPLKRFSTGMQLRLAFAIAAHLEADTLLVDEVLAVGDIEFQRRGLGKISELTAEGRTAMFVSHDVGAIMRLCPRTIWIERGEVKADGPTEPIVEAYLAASVAARVPMIEFERRSDRAVQILSATLIDPRGAAIACPRRDQPSRCAFVCWLVNRCSDLIYPCT